MSVGEQSGISSLVVTGVSVMYFPDTQPPIPTFADGGDLKNGRYAPSCIYSDRKSPDFRNVFHERFRHFAAFSSIGITTEFLFVGMVLSSPGYPSNLIIDRQAAEAWRHAGAHIRANDRGKTTIGASQVEFVAGTTNRRVSMANPLIRSKARGPRNCRSAEFLLSDRRIA